MNSSDNTKEKLHKEDYDAEPVVYCKNCLSLKIINLDDDTCYCDKCGCTNVESTDIRSWERMYGRKYGKSF